MKKLVLVILLFTSLVHGIDGLFLAIKHSNPVSVKHEIGKLTLKGTLLSEKDKHMYLDLAEEVIIRRRNSLQFPRYYDGRPVYTKAFPSDEDPSLSLSCGLRLIIGTLGTIIALPYCIDSFLDYNHNRTNTYAIAAEIVSILLFLSAAIEFDIQRKQHQEQLYENAVEIKHILINVETA